MVAAGEAFDPMLIVYQMVALQCFYYLAAGVLFGACHVLFGTRVSLDLFFSAQHLTTASAAGWLEIVIVLLGAFAGCAPPPRRAPGPRGARAPPLYSDPPPPAPDPTISIIACAARCFSPSSSRNARSASISPSRSSSSTCSCVPFTRCARARLCGIRGGPDAVITRFAALRSKSPAHGIGGSCTASRSSS